MHQPYKPGKPDIKLTKKQLADLNEGNLVSTLRVRFRGHVYSSQKFSHCLPYDDPCITYGNTNIIALERHASPDRYSRYGTVPSITNAVQ